VITIAKKTISYGASGSEVKKLQEKLNSKGYSLEVDGKFGAKTQAAVRDYQKKNNLSVDGIVGNATWGSLESSSSPKKTVTSTSQSKEWSYGVAKPTYKKSEAVLEAEKKLGDWEKNKPQEYSSRYSEEIDGILKEILNRGDFEYSLSSDPLYEQYKELYMQNGKKAMMDTIGQASALTGGYGNSYAVTAGNQAYQDYLTQLDDVALDLREMAYKQYNDEHNALIDDVNLLRSLDGDDYEKYLQLLSEYYNDGDYLLKKLSAMSDSEYETFLTQLEAWESDRDYAFKQHQDALDRDEFEKEMAFKKAEAERDQANADRSYALAVSKASSSGGGKSQSDDEEKSGSKKTGVLFYPSTYKEFYLKTGVSTILTESEFASSEAYKREYKGSYKEYLKAMYKKHMK
jgi:hypothetical protein